MPIHRIFEYRSERDRDLLNAYRRQIAQSSGPIQLREVMYRVVNSPSSRFWVSPERAMRVISSMDQGNRLNGMIRNKRIMFREIYRRVHQTQNSSALSAVTIIRGSPDSGWATRPLFLQDSTERHCDHAPHQFRIPFIVLLLVLFLLPVSPDQTGAVSGGPLWCYVVYMFFHANLFHLLGNCLSVYLVWHFRSDPPPFVVAASLYGVALLAALITCTDTPTVGASGVVFASVGFRLNRCRRKLLQLSGRCICATCVKRTVTFAKSLV